jgi:putative zinc finger/helix-turn-helix YgiT family protein
MTRSDKPFPWRCTDCGETAIEPDVIDHTSMIKCDGRLHEVRVPNLSVLRCRNCGEVLFGNEADEQIARALRDKLHLLQPEQIRENRAHESIGLKQSEFARKIGVAVESLSRWENGHVIQSRGHDRFMRSFFALPELRAFLDRLEEQPDLGGSVGDLMLNLAETRPGWLEQPSPHQPRWSRGDPLRLRSSGRGDAKPPPEGGVQDLSLAG